jgi:hypothetical protein
LPSIGIYVNQNSSPGELWLGCDLRTMTAKKGRTALVFIN